MRHVQGAISNISESLATVVTNQDTVNTEISKINSGLESLRNNLGVDSVVICDFQDYREKMKLFKGGVIDSFGVQVEDLDQGVPTKFMVTIKPCENDEKKCMLGGIKGQVNPVRIENVAGVIKGSHGRLTDKVKVQ